jgi:ribonuclease Z
MEFEVIILGTSSALPTSDRYPTAQVLHVLGQFFLIDCGEGTQIQLRKNNISLQRINQIFISHLHGDHYFGLFGFLSSVNLLGRTKKIEIFGPKGLKKIIESHLESTESVLQYPIEINELAINEGEKSQIFENKVLKVQAFNLNHSIPCLGYLFEEPKRKRRINTEMVDYYQVPLKFLKNLQEGEDFENTDGRIIQNNVLTKEPIKNRRYAFCTDTSFFPEIVPFIYKVDLLYHETTFLQKDKDRARQTGHSTTFCAAKIAKLAKVDTLLIGHYSTRYSKLELFLDETVKTFENTKLAKENLRISIPLQT